MKQTNTALNKFETMTLLATCRAASKNKYKLMTPLEDNDKPNIAASDKRVSGL